MQNREEEEPQIVVLKSKPSTSSARTSPNRSDFYAAQFARDGGQTSTAELLGSPVSAPGELVGLGRSQDDSAFSHRLYAHEHKPATPRPAKDASPRPPERARSESTDEQKMKMMAYVADLTEDPYATQCGIGRHRPFCLQFFASQGWMLFWLCWYCTVQGLLVNGLVPSVLTTIERRFEFTTSMLGTIMQFYDIGYLLACIPISYFGGRHSKPLFIGVGLLIIGCGSFLFSIPHIVSDRYVNQDHEYLSSCPVAPNPLLGQTPATLRPVCLASTADGASTPSSDRQWYLFIFCLAHFLHGVGATPLFTLGVAYIDENVKPTLSSVYIGVYYAFAIFGPAIGFLLSGAFLRYHTDFLAEEQSVKLSDISESDPKWVGAWWVGFQLSSLLAFIAVFPILSFPKILPNAFNYYRFRVKEEIIRTTALAYRKELQASKHYKVHRRAFSDFQHKHQPLSVPQASHMGHSLASSVGDLGPEGLANKNINGSEKKSKAVVPVKQAPVPPLEDPVKEVGMAKKILTDFMVMPRAVTRLLTNPSYLFITLAASIDGLLVTGLSAFMAKYLERQFNIRTSRSNMLIGSIMVPVAGLGTMVSGYVIKRFRLTCPSTLKFCISMVVFSLVLSPMFLVYCDHSPLVGVETLYPNENASDSIGPRTDEEKLLSSCNQNCSCVISEYAPVCAPYDAKPGGHGDEVPDGLSFFSPCYAGCPVSASQKSYEGCTCAPGGKVKKGLCESACSGLIGFLILFGPMCFCTFSVGVPALSVVLRCVDHSERSFALGIQWILIRLIGTIPASSVFGWLFDISCVRRYVDPCSGADGTCYVYNNKLLADLFLAFALIGQTGTLLFLVLALVFFRNKPGRDDPIKT